MDRMEADQVKRALLLCCGWLESRPGTQRPCYDCAYMTNDPDAERCYVTLIRDAAKAIEWAQVQQVTVTKVERPESRERISWWDTEMRESAVLGVSMPYDVCHACGSSHVRVGSKHRKFCEECGARMLRKE